MTNWNATYEKLNGNLNYCFSIESFELMQQIMIVIAYNKQLHHQNVQHMSFIKLKYLMIAHGEILVICNHIHRIISYGGNMCDTLIVKP